MNDESQEPINNETQQLTLGEIIGVILGIAVLTFLIFGFSTGWANLWCGVTGCDSIDLEQKAILDLVTCLNDSGAVMYGTNWCGSCQEQKKLFGESFEKINFMDCSLEPTECLIQGIESYPTWKMNNKTREGLVSLENLEIWSGCNSSSQGEYGGGEEPV